VRVQGGVRVAEHGDPLLGGAERVARLQHARHVPLAYLSPVDSPQLKAREGELDLVGDSPHTGGEVSRRLGPHRPAGPQPRVAQAGRLSQLERVGGHRLEHVAARVQGGGAGVLRVQPEHPPSASSGITAGDAHREAELRLHPGPLMVNQFSEAIQLRARGHNHVDQVL
jgi:hypothetical protein